MPPEDTAPAVPVPASLMTLLSAFTSVFTAPTLRAFTALACGFLAGTGRRSVCGMLTGAGLSRLWPHDRAHGFLYRARWNPDKLGICAAKLVISLLVPVGAPIEVLIGDTLLKRRGKKVWAASWFHDGSAPGLLFTEAEIAHYVTVARWPAERPGALCTDHEDEVRDGGAGGMVVVSGVARDRAAGIGARRD